MLPQPPWIMIRGLVGAGFSDDEGDIVGRCVWEGNGLGWELRFLERYWERYMVWSGRSVVLVSLELR